MESKQPDKHKRFPGAIVFFTSVGLYTEFDISTFTNEYLRRLLGSEKTLDCYCVECDQHSIFSQVLSPSSAGNTNDSHYVSDNKIKDGIYEKEFTCSRDRDHKMTFFLRVKNGMISKIGQTPSLADIVTGDISKYRGLLGKHYNEYSKSIGLYAHGVGVGAFVYLRRIIENYIVKPAYEEAKTTPSWDDDVYMQSRVGERIELLKGHLPSFFVQNKAMYGIISKGIHELSEEDCKAYFPPLRTTLELVLTDLLAKKELENKKKEMQIEIAKIAGETK